MAVNLSGGNGKLSFEEWRKQRGGSTAPASTSSAMDGKLSFEEWRKQRDQVRNSTASPALPEPAKALDKSGLNYGNSAVLPLRYYPERLDDGKSLEAERLRTVAEKLDYQAARKTADELAKQNRAVELFNDGKRYESGRLESEVRKEARERQKTQRTTAGKLRDKAYATEQEGIKKFSERLAASDPEFYSKAQAGYEKPAGKERKLTLSDNSLVGLNRKVAEIDLTSQNPIQRLRNKELQDVGMTNIGETLNEQLMNSELGKHSLSTPGALSGLGGVNISDMTPEELKTYSYWYEKSPHAAKRYLESISADVNKRTAERETGMFAETTRELRDSNPISGAGAVGMQLMLDTYASPMAFASNIGAKLTGKEYDPYSGMNRGMLNASAMQEGLTGDLPTFGKFLADTGLSTAQFLSRIPLGAAGLAVMASGAAGKTANEVKRSGGSTDQALKLGTIAGIAEYASEKIPFENVAAAFKGGEKKAIAGFLGNAMKSSLGQSLGAVAGSMAEEGFEELITEYVNNIANEAIMGDDSEMKKYARELVEGGMEYEAACREAFKQYYVVNPLVSFAGGALSGAVMTGAGEAWNKRGEIARAGVNSAVDMFTGKTEREYLKNRISDDRRFATPEAAERSMLEYERKNGIGNKLDRNETEQAEYDYHAPVDAYQYDGTPDADLLDDPEIRAAVEESGLTTTDANEAQTEPKVNPKDEQFDKNGNFILRTAGQENRIRRAKASNNDIERSGRLAGATDSQIKTAQTLSKVFGRNIIFDSTEANVNGKFADGTIYVNPKGTDNVGTILAHEFTHSLEGTKQYDGVVNMLKQMVADRGGNWNDLMDQVRDEYEARYENMGQEFTDADCENETIAKVAQSLFNDDAAIETFAAQNRSAAARFWHRLSQGVKKFGDIIGYNFQKNFSGNFDPKEWEAHTAMREMETLRDRFAAALRKTKKSFGEGESRMFIKYDKSNTPYVEIDRDVLEGVPKKQWVKEIKKHIPNILSVKVGNEEIGVNSTSENELLYSRYSQWLSRNNSEVYHDKLTTLPQISEIIRATRNYVNEGLNHERKDSIKQFARGIVNFKSGKNEYQAEVVCGITDSGKSILYDIIKLSPIEINKKNTASADGELSRQSQSSNMAVPSDDGKQLFGYTEPARAPQKTTTDSNIISHSGENVNTSAKENSGKSEHSLADSQYGTKPQNSAEAQNREKALAMLERGKDPEYVFTLTGCFKDDFGNLVVDHEADIYLYGKNESENEAKLRAENENLKKQTADVLESKKSGELNVEAMHEAYERGKADTREALEKALHTAPNMTPDAKYIRKLSKEVIGDDVSQSKQKKLTKRITELYDRMGEIQSAGQQIRGNEEISKEMDAIATEIQDSRFVTDNDRAAERDSILKEFKTPMFLSPKARGDFAEGYSNLKKQMGKRMTLVGKDKGVPVDVRYMELNEQFGNGWFPAEIVNEADQFAHMMNVVKTVSARDYAKKSYYDFSGWENVYKDEHANIMMKLAEGYTNLEQRPKDWSDKIVFNIRESFQQMERDHAAKTEKIVAEMQAEFEKVQADSEKTLSEYQDYMNKRISDAVQGSLKYKEENDKLYHSRVNTAIDQANKRVAEVTDYYESKEKARLDKEAAEQAARAQRRHDRGGDISADKVNAAVEDGSFHSKMLRLYDTAKDLSEECAKYANVDIESLSEDHKAEVKKLFEQLDNINSYINKVHQVQKKVLFDRALAEIAKGDIMAWKDKGTGLGYAINTMVRNIEDISKGDELGKQIVEKYVKPVHKHEAMKQRFMTSMRERVQALDLSMQVTDGNKLSESAMVQLLGECRSNIQMLEDGNGNAVNKSGEPIREGRTLDEWRAIQTTILAENQNMNMEKIEGAITEFHAIYDELFDALNRARVLAGYAPVDYHAGYFPHFNNQSGQDGILANIMSGLGLSLDNDALPTSINGLTHTFRPGIKYMSNVKQRSVYGVGDMYNGFTLTAGAVEGFDRYIQTAADVIYHTEDIQNLRALSDAIRYSTTDKGRKKQIDTLRADSTLTPQEQDSRIAELFENKQHYRLSNFVVNLEEWTNIIAGKKSILDRQFEQLLGRSMYQNMKRLEQRIAANQVSLNPGSWLTNFVPLTQAGSVLTQKQLLNAMWDTVKNTKQSDGFRERSDFLTNRFGSENLVQTKADKFAKTLGKPMEIIDGFTAESIVRARYAQNIAKGLTESDAMSEADMFAYKLMANRAKGDMPTIFHASNPVLKLFTQYQLEVNNQLAFILKDLPKEAKARDPKWFKEWVKMVVKMSIGAWLYNEAYELLVGRRCATDPWNIFAQDFAGDISGFKAPGISDFVDVAIGKKEWSEIAKTERKGVGTAFGNLGTNLVQELPFIGGVLGGGRIPIQSAIPNFSNLGKALDPSSGWSASKRVSTGIKEVAKPAAYILPPFGGGQVKKAIEGTMAFAQGGAYTRDEKGRKQLQYPVENRTVSDKVLNLPRAVLFGKTSNRYGRDWVDDGFGSLSVKATKAYEALVDDGMDQGDAYESMKEIRTFSERADKVKFLRGLDGNSDAKRVVFEQMILGSADSIESASDKLDSLDDANISIDYYLDAYEAYLRGEGDARKVDTVNAIQSSGLSSEQKDVLYCCFYREKGLPDTPWHNLGGRKIMANENGLAELPKVSMPTINMPTINMPKLK